MAQIQTRSDHKSVLADYLDFLPSGTVIAASDSATIPGHELVAAVRLDSRFDEEEWMGLSANGSARRAGTSEVVGLLRRVDPLAVARLAFDASGAVVLPGLTVKEGQTYVRCTHEGSFAVRVAGKDLDDARGMRLPVLSDLVVDHLAGAEKVAGTVDGVRGVYLLLGDGSGRRVNVHDGTIVDHSEIEGARDVSDLDEL